jgi:tripartite-type tricarboxylate transporter receptor subunit TctC
VIGKQVHSMWGFMAGLVPYMRSGSVRALAVGSKERSEVLPEVPTVAEAGVPSFEAVAWAGMLARAGTLERIVEALWKAGERTLHLPEVAEMLSKTGTEIVFSTPRESAQTLASDYEKFAKLSDLFAK